MRSKLCHLHLVTDTCFQLRATLPVTVFISPNLPIDENNNLIERNPQAALRALEDLAQQAPPLYGEHQFDQLYSELDISGYRTPGNGSGPGTPFGTLSRNLSAENLASMNALMGPNISASALHSRLSSLHANSMNSDNPAEADAGNRNSNSHSPGGAELSRRPSDEVDHDHLPSGMVTPYPQYDEIESLSRVPSYETAVRTAPRTPYNNADLPDYESATAGDFVTPPPRSPQQVHLRGGGRSHHFSFADMYHRPHFFGHSRSTSHGAEARARG